MSMIYSMTYTSPPHQHIFIESIFRYFFTVYRKAKVVKQVAGCGRKEEGEKGEGREEM